MSSWSPRVVAVTGASGMVGRHVVAVLEECGIAALGLGRADWDLREWLSRDQLAHILGAADAVVHAGAIVRSPPDDADAKDLFDANVRSALCLGQWAASAGKPVIFISGAAVYADPSKPRLTERDALAERPGLGGAYGFSKRLGEMVLRSCIGDGLKLCVLRPSSIYGAGQAPDRMVASLLMAALAGKDIVLEEPVDDRINLVHASDVAQAVLRALMLQAWDTFNIGGSGTPAVREIGEACIGVAGRGTLRISSKGAARTPCLRFDVDTTKAQTELGFRPLSLRKGLEATASHMDWVN